MVDPVSFPALAGAALSGAISFLYGRVGAVLDRRAGRVSPAEPDMVAGWPSPLWPDIEAIDEQDTQRLERLAHALTRYQLGAEVPRGDDPQLRLLLGSLRRDLETIYGVPFAFGDEQCAGPAIRVEQTSVQVAGQQHGITAGGVGPQASLTVVQHTGIVHADAEQTGVRIDGTIG